MINKQKYFDVEMFTLFFSINRNVSTLIITRRQAKLIREFDFSNVKKEYETKHKKELKMFLKDMKLRNEYISEKNEIYSNEVMFIDKEGNYHSVIFEK